MTSSQTSPRPARPTANPGRDLALIAVFAAFIAVCALLPAIPVGPAAVPITLQTLAIYIAALTLGGTRTTLAVTLYLLAGLIGLPVFSGGKGGFGTIASPSFGYLLGFIPGALLTGSLAYAALRRRLSGAGLFGAFVVAVLAGFALIQVFGVAGMMINAQLELGAAVTAALIYVPGDLMKCLVAVIVALAVHRAFPALSHR
ncbi:MAG: biotin transporter BioY [Rothia sp. (in: high G+C Gram-positive bacteria)]|uniref:biotin transporter BioY n=1 Tax=Rothia sp. (in: high G+C Gram-positive bacteria) TaxID=1885016 RepID=UPI0026F8FAA3|nr:biotin transporter BioY [Rothia sp. (in: high G+C Gram-positive bacteria)]